MRGVVLDNGVGRFHTLANGAIVGSHSFDSDDLFAWSEIQTGYDQEGRVAGRLVSFDDGRTDLSIFTDGVRVDRTVTDVGDNYNWATRVFDYHDTTGALLTTTTTYDDGMVQLVLPGTANAGQTITRLDTLNEYNWDQFVRTYDSDGAIAQRVLTFDNGVAQTSSYTSGLLVRNDWTDPNDQHGWSTRYNTYDGNGRISKSHTVLDDGRTIELYYVAGVRATRTVTDPTEQRSWTSIVTTYDADGVITNSLLTYDDGVTSTRSYANGVLIDELILDPDDARPWISVNRVFDSTGAHSYTHTVMNDGTETYVDVRGQEIVTGGSVTEDAGILLETSGAITLLGDYRGSAEFTPIASVVGENGLGVFTLGADGSWTFAANNNQAAIQELGDGETTTDSFTATTTDGMDVTVTATIEGVPFVDAPVYLDETMIEGDLAAGNLSAAQTGLDISGLFSHDDGEDILFFTTGVPAGISFVNGLFTNPDITDLSVVGEYDINIAGIDEGGASTIVDLDFVVTLQHDFGNFLRVMRPRQCRAAKATIQSYLVTMPPSQEDSCGLLQARAMMRSILATKPQMILVR